MGPTDGDVDIEKTMRRLLGPDWRERPAKEAAEALQAERARVEQERAHHDRKLALAEAIRAKIQEKGAGTAGEVLDEVVQEQFGGWTPEAKQVWLGLEADFNISQN